MAAENSLGSRFVPAATGPWIGRSSSTDGARSSAGGSWQPARWERDVVRSDGALWLVYRQMRSPCPRSVGRGCVSRALLSHGSCPVSARHLSDLRGHVETGSAGPGPSTQFSADQAGFNLESFDVVGPAG